MIRNVLTWLAVGATASAAFIVIACSDNPSGPNGSNHPNFVAADFGAGNQQPNLEEIEVCKHGSSASIKVDMTQNIGPSTVTHVFADGDCEVLGQFDGNHPADISANELVANLPPGIQFDHLTYTVIHGTLGGPTTTDAPVTSNTNSFTANGADNHIGFLVEFFNTEVPGGQGCTPGYWKVSQHWDSWVGFTTSQTLESVFDVPDGLGYDNVTLVAALSFQGGPGVSGGAQILLRAGVAALLNASNPNVNYPLTTQQVIDAVNAALASNDRATELTLASSLDADNNLGCPLN
jgi:hypothetical protein